MEADKIILGLDPGYADTGWGIIRKQNNKLELVACGSIKTSKEQPLSARLQTLEQELNILLQQHQPDLVGIEKLFFNTNTTTAIAVAQARGVLLITLQHKKIPLIELTPLQIKQSLTNSGSAPKKQVAKMVMALLKLTAIPASDDATDALACAICTSFQQNWLK